MLLIRNIKELVQVEEKPVRLRAGKEMQTDETDGYMHYLPTCKHICPMPPGPPVHQQGFHRHADRRR